MTTLLSAEWYKLWHGKVLAIILAGVTGQTLLQVLAELTSVHPTPGQYGVVIPAGLSFLLQVWLMAFVGYFVASEFQNGTMRNILSLGKNRTLVYLSKLLSSCIAIIAIYTAITLVATAGFSAVAGFGDMGWSEFWRFFSWNFFMQILYHLIYAALYTMFAFLSRSLGMTILLGVGSMILMSLLPPLLNMTGLSPVIEYLPNYYIDGFGRLSGEPDFVAKGVIVSAGYFVVTCIVGFIVFKRSDIK